jgi:D-glycero-alpha-D-manno-heptose 1-phosphate guanylyltransferase
MRAGSAILLAGGAGTRLQLLAGTTPKCLMPVAGTPLLYYLLMQLYLQQFAQVVLALGHGAAQVQAAAKAWASYHPGMQVLFSTEETPLGTGGAIAKALQQCTNRHVLVLNADTYVATDYKKALQAHQAHEKPVTVLLVGKTNADRYGTVQLDREQRITAFNEKRNGSSGWINAGAYWLQADHPLLAHLPAQFSWEKDWLQPAALHHLLHGHPVSAYFIDIGIPTDYQQAQTDFEKIPMLQPQPDWTLFLDRDGVINIEKENDYIHSWDEFAFYPDALSSIAGFSRLFRRIIVVTNQKGIGKGVTKREEVENIHARMTEAVQAAGGRIDGIYYCPDTADDSPCRKPNAGMALQARADFPDIDFQRSIMVGNNVSDLHFARRAGMHAVFLRTTQPQLVLPPALADMEVQSLTQLLQSWQGAATLQAS